jgi:hypothetical protein
MDARKAKQGRTALSGDRLLQVMRRGFARIADHRPSCTISLADALMSGFAMFSLKCPSLLSFDKKRADPNLRTVYGIEQAPCDTQMREALDPVDPAQLEPLFEDVFRVLQRSKALESFVYWNDCYLLPLDGTGYFSSQSIHCENCLEKHHRNGEVTYQHQLLGAALVHPDHRAVIPLAPEPIIKQDGATKNDCERNAAKRFLEKLRRAHPHLKVIVTGDGLASNGPHIRDLRDKDCHFILGAKPGDHASLFQTLTDGLETGESFEYTHTDEKGVAHQFLYRNGVPLNQSNPDLLVNALDYWEHRPGKKNQHFTWVTDLKITRQSAVRIMRGGRCRWKIENETFNTLKNQGYHFEHNFGHGKQNLSVVFAMLLMLAFLVDQAQQIGCRVFQRAWQVMGSKRDLWEKLRSLFFNHYVDSITDIFAAIGDGFERQRLKLRIDPDGATPDTS